MSTTNWVRVSTVWWWLLVANTIVDNTVTIVVLLVTDLSRGLYCGLAYLCVIQTGPNTRLAGPFSCIIRASFTKVYNIIDFAVAVVVFPITHFSPRLIGSFADLGRPLTCPGSNFALT